MSTTAKAYIAFAATLIIGLMTAQGCDLRQLVRVDVPEPILNPLDIEGPITLDEAERVWADWTYYVESNTERFREAHDDAEQRYAFVHSLVSIGWNAAGEAASGFPFGALAFGALTGGIGLFLPQPKIARKKGE
jgi:hypothetical protein